MYVRHPVTLDEMKVKVFLEINRKKKKIEDKEVFRVLVYSRKREVTGRRRRRRGGGGGGTRKVDASLVVFPFILTICVCLGGPSPRTWLGGAQAESLC